MKRIIVLSTIAALMLGVLAAGVVYANNNEDAGAKKCSEATLHGTYLFAFDGVEIKGNNDQVPFAIAGYAVFDGNGKEKGVASSNFNGEVTRNEPVSGTYTVKADCTGTVTFADGSQIDHVHRPRWQYVYVRPDQALQACGVGV